MKHLTGILLCAALLVGCATAPPPPLFTVPAASQAVAPPPADKAQIIFLQPFKPVGGTADTALYEIRGTSRELLGFVSSKTRFVKLVEPGQHMYMAMGGFGAHFLQADVEAGKRYYVLSRFIAYVGYQLRPVLPSGPSDYSASIPQFGEWLRESTIVDSTPEGMAWYADWGAKNQATIDKMQARGWETWQRKTLQERAELTLLPIDAVAR